jgi:hypothetical protein
MIQHKVEPKIICAGHIDYLVLLHVNHSQPLPNTPEFQLYQKCQYCKVDKYNPMCPHYKPVPIVGIDLIAETANVG